MSEQTGREVPGPPVTGEPEVDAALVELADLDPAPLGEHHERLARAHEVLREALQGDDAAPR